MKAYIIVATAVGLLANQLSAATVMSGPFILVPDYFNGLESIGADYYLGGPSYSECGITISYLGTITPQARGAGPQSNSV